MGSKFRYTRNHYMKKVCTHEEYYSQFVDDYIREDVLRFFGENALLNSKNNSFNEIELSAWEKLAKYHTNHIGRKYEGLDDSPTIAGIICVLKEAARQVKIKLQKGESDG